MKVMILGHNGLLGYMVKKWLEKSYSVFTTDERWPSNQFKKSIEIKVDAIINCIGAIPQKNIKYDVNYELPWFLDKNVNTLVIHPGTDCESDMSEYGVSKKQAYTSIIQNSGPTKIIKTSFVGPERDSSFGLFSWLVNQKFVDGYTNVFWNGVTSLYWAKLAELIILNPSSFGKVTIPTTNCISKFQLISYINSIFNLNVTINPYAHTYSNKCLQGNLLAPSIQKQLYELKNYLENEQ